MIAVTYITLAILYTIACVMDGPDVKPLWKRWLGGKLEVHANKLKPINYCNRADCWYLHQLQHALKLCGIEKEIKL